MNKFLVLPLLFIFSALQAQRIGIKGGINYSTAKVSDSTVKLNAGYVPGFNLGLTAAIDFDKNLQFTPSLSYSLKGFTFYSGNGLAVRTEMHIHYLDLGALLSYSLPVLQHKLSLNAGPVASIAIAGTQKTTVGGITSSSKMRFSLEKDFGYIDLGVYLGFLYTYHRYFLQAGWQSGFINMNNNAEFNKRNIRNRVFNLSAGFYFR